MGQTRSKVVAKGKRRPASVVFDSGALIALERGDARVRALLREAMDSGVRIVIPAGVLAQVWRTPATQVALGALARASATTVVPLDAILAEAVGVLCGKRKTSDVSDASVVLTARREGAPIVTSDVEDLRHLDDAIELHRV